MGVKWAAIRRLVKKEHVDMICFQETKKEIIVKSACQALWGDLEVNYEVTLMLAERCEALLTQQEAFYVYGVKKLSSYKGKSLAVVLFY